MMLETGDIVLTNRTLTYAMLYEGNDKRPIVPILTRGVVILAELKFARPLVKFTEGDEYFVDPWWVTVVESEGS